MPNHPKHILPPTHSLARAEEPDYQHGGDWEGAEPEGLPLSFYGMLLRRRQKWITTFVLLTTVISTLVALVLPKQYSSTAILRIDPQGIHTVGENSSESNSVQLSARELVTTESQIVTSPAVVLKTVESLRLYADPEFSPNYQKFAAAGKALSERDLDQVVRLVTKQISVSQPLDTFLLSVSFRAHSPQLAAQVANQLVQSLVELDYSTRVQALMGSSTSMQAQVDELRAKMEKSERALVDYESSHDVLAPDSKDNIMQARLSQINQDLVESQAKRMGLQADYETVKSNDLDALLATDRGQYLLPLQNRLLADENRLAQDGEVYGPNFPTYRQQAAVVNYDRKALQVQERHVARQIEDQYATARAREKLLTAELQRQKRQMDQFNLKAIRYHALKGAADSYSTLFYQLQQQIQNVSVAANLHSEMLRVISPARPSDKPVFPRPLLTAILAFILSAGLACSAAIAYGMMDRRLSNPEQIEYWLQLPTLAALPQVDARDGTDQLSPVADAAPRLLAGGHGGAERPVSPRAPARHSPFREGIFNLHSALTLAQGQDLQVIAITSSLPSEGKSTIAAHLATVFASLRRRTVLVDADMRKPSVHRQFRISNRQGLSSILRGQCDLESALIEIESEPGLMLLPAGPVPARPIELLHLGLSDVLEQLRGRFDCVIIDCPPMLGFADAAAVGNIADGVVVVARAGHTERAQILATIRALGAARAHVLGVVLNEVHKHHGSYYGYYQTYTQYYSHDPEDQASEEE